MNLKKCLIISLSALLVSCAVAPNKKQMLTQYNAGEHIDYTKNGVASISGQAFLKQAGGGVVTCAGNEVFLMPDTPFFKEVISIIQSKSLPSVPGDNRDHVQATRKQICDAQGSYTFANLPAKKWILMTHVNWVVSYVEQGDMLVEYIDLTKEQSTKVVLTDKNRMGVTQ